MSDAADREGAALGAMLGTCVGDALGMAYEGRPAAAVPERPEMRDARLGRGTYTDDTQMTIALAESLLRCGTVDEEDLGRTFVAHFDPARGYGRGTTSVLEDLVRGVPVSEAAARAFDGRGSLGNGAAMRIAPVAVRFAGDPAVVDAQARRSARVTHAHPVAVDAAAAQAAAIAAALRGVEPLKAAEAAAKAEEVRAALRAVAGRAGRELHPRALTGELAGVPPRADLSVAAAVAAGSLAQSFEEAVTVAVRAGGDTDTTAAMAGAIAGARFGLDGIPSQWLEVLEDGERGRRHVERLARALVGSGDGPRAAAPQRRF